MIIDILSEFEKIFLVFWIKEIEKNKETYAVYGTGKITLSILQLIQTRELMPPVHIIDHRKFLDMDEKFKVFTPEKGSLIAPDWIILGSNTFHTEMRKQIHLRYGKNQKILDFSHIRKAAKGVSNFVDEERWHQLLTLVNTAASTHSNYALFGNTPFNKTLISKLKLSGIKLPSCILVKKRCGIDNINGIPVYCFSEKGPLKANAIVTNISGKMYFDIQSELKEMILPDTRIINLTDISIETDYRQNIFGCNELPFIYAKVLFLGINNKCNLCCKYCHGAEERKILNKSKDMPFKLAVEILNQFKGHIHLLSLGSYGEPLLYPHLEKLISTATDMGYLNVDFPTNAVLLTREKSISLAQAGLNHIHVSLDSLDSDYNKKFRGINTSQVIANLEGFSRLTGLEVAVNAVVTSDNLHLISELPSLKARVPTLKRIDLLPVTAQSENYFKQNFQDDVSHFALDSAMAQFRINCEHYGVECSGLDLLTRMNLRNRIKACTRAWTHIYISAVGDMTVCNSSYFHDPGLYVGNVKDVDNMLTLFNGKRMQEIRSQLMSGTLPESCKVCRYAE